MSGQAGGPRALPSVDRVLADPSLAALAVTHGRPSLLAAARSVLASYRQRAIAGEITPDLSSIASTVAAELTTAARRRLRRAINGTGVIIQTNLGRAPVSAATARAMADVAAGYSNLEFDLEQGTRGSRTSHLEPLLCELTGAEAALAVNNNASALLLALSALARGRQVVISRGQLVEIGGGFRVPDVMAQSGAQLVEVGTTNRTYARDYEQAIGEATAAVMRVHTSNYRVVGFVAEATLGELVTIARERSVQVIDDLGSGALLDTADYGLAHEPIVGESIADGADLVCFSGDKLLGGPQAGILVGRHATLDQLKRHPLARAVRLDKASIAGLEATLQHYRRGEAVAAIPVWQMIAMPTAALDRRAAGWARALRRNGVAATVEDGASAVGGGSLPGETLPTRLLTVKPTIDASKIAARLRALDPPLIARIERARVVIDPRTVLPGEDALVRSHLLQSCV